MWFCNHTEKWRELQNGSGWWSFAHNESNGRNGTISLLPKERYFLFPQNEIDRSDKHSTVKSLIGYCFCAVWLGFILQKWCGILSLHHCLSLVNVQSIEHTYTLIWMTDIFWRILPKQIHINCNHFFMLCHLRIDNTAWVGRNKRIVSNSIDYANKKWKFAHFMIQTQMPPTSIVMSISNG